MKREFSLFVPSLVLLSSLSAVLLEGDTELLLSLILLRYSEGFMRLFESPIPGNDGGTNGRTLCLLTRFGPPCFSESSPSKLTMVKSEHDEFSLLAAKMKTKGIINIYMLLEDLHS